MMPGRVSPAARFDGDPFIAITMYYNDQEYPFDQETNELLKTIYSDPVHSAKFFKAFFDNWLPNHKKTVEQREKCRGFFTKILADNQRCFDLRDILPDDR
jgi:hypothetical protein